MSDQNPAPNKPSKDPATGTQVFLTGAYLLVLPFVIFTLLVLIWPLGKAPGATDSSVMVTTFKSGTMHLEIALLLIVMLCGALGSVVFIANAFAVRVANGSLGRKWVLWYFIRVPVGMGLALIVYFVLRGGLFAGTFANPEVALKTINPFGFAGLATLAGMFAKEATKKLEEIFEVIFKTDKNPDEGGAAGQMPPTTPQIKSLVPDTVSQNESDPKKLSITVNGSQFPVDAVVNVGKSIRQPVNPTAEKLAFNLDAADLTAGGPIEISVGSKSNKQTVSNKKTLKVKKSGG